jgi:hypothetical protein
MNYKIYGLRVIGTEEIRYVGYTKRELSQRLYHHFADAKQGLTYKKCYWIRKHNYNIESILLEDKLSYEQALQQEIYWIKQFSNLLNMTEGGDKNPMENPEVKAKHAAKMKTLEPAGFLLREVNYMNTEEGTNWIKDENKRRWESGVYNDSHTKFKKIIDKDSLYQLYIIDNKTLKECAEILNTTYRSVVRNLGNYQIKKYNNGK